MQTILVAHDAEEREILTFVLRHGGLAVANAPALDRVAARWLQRPADLIVVAWDGEHEEMLAAIGAVRGVTQVPLLLVGEPRGEAATCELLQAGADLVLARPVSPRLLAQYARTLLRRAHAIPAFRTPPLDLGQVRLDPASRAVTVAGAEPQRLTQLEYRLLYVLMSNREHVVPVEVIVERVWGYNGEGNRDLVRGLVSRLRRKIELDPELPHVIETIPGTGYRFSVAEAGELV
jgi:DNA-binding response OmpR family regulator